MKIIMHVDFNSFFASVEQQANPFLRGKPIAIIGKRGIKDIQRSVVAAASIEAKKLGVKTPMPASKAKKICPELILLPGDMRKYNEITKRMLNVLKKNCDKVEQFSTDEAFADITHVAEDYFGATIIAQIIRNQISKQCGKFCPVSIGIGPNKAIAKLASGSVKQNGLTIIQPNEVELFLNKQSLSAICGIGKATKQRLEKLGILSFKTLRETKKGILLNEFKTVTGNWLYNIARGMDDDKVNNKIENPKSMSHSYTFPYNLESDIEIQTNLLALSDQAAYRLRKNKYIALSISLSVKYDDFSQNHIQIKLKNPVQDGLTIYKNAWELLKKIRKTHKSIRLLGINTHNLIQSNSTTSLFKKERKIQRTLEACDCIKMKFGQKSIIRAAVLKTTFNDRVSGW